MPDRVKVPTLYTHLTAAVRRVGALPPSQSRLGWAHIVMKEKALIQWRAQFKSDGARKFSEVEGGLNQMTIRRFEELLKKSPFAVEKFELVPIRGLKPLHNQITREFLTAVVRCTLRKPPVTEGTA